MKSFLLDCLNRFVYNMGMNKQHKGQLESLVSDTIRPAMIEDLGIDVEDDKKYKEAIDYLIKLLVEEKG